MCAQIVPEPSIGQIPDVPVPQLRPQPAAASQKANPAININPRLLGFANMQYDFKINQDGNVKFARWIIAGFLVIFATLLAIIGVIFWKNIQKKKYATYIFSVAIFIFITVLILLLIFSNRFCK